MAAIAVLRSQDCLGQSHIPKSHYNSNPKPKSKARRRKRSSAGLESKGRDEIKNRTPYRTPKNVDSSPKNMVMGQVKILKRGEPLPDPKKTAVVEKVGSGGACDDDIEVVLGSMGRLGPEPEMVQKQIRAWDFYAGSAPIVASPHPSALPLPSILPKKKKIDAASGNLFRPLRLDCP